MEELSMKLNELQKQVKRITKSKQKKHMSSETLQYFCDVLNGVDDLNRNILGYKGTNIYLFNKLGNSISNSYIQY